MDACLPRGLTLVFYKEDVQGSNPPPYLSNYQNLSLSQKSHLDGIGHVAFLCPNREESRFGVIGWYTINDLNNSCMPTT